MPDNPEFIGINAYVAFPDSSQRPCYQRFKVPGNTLQAVYPYFCGNRAMPEPSFFQSAILTDQKGLGQENLPTNGPLHGRFVEFSQLQPFLERLDELGQLVPLPGSRPVIGTTVRAGEPTPRADTVVS